MKDLCHTQYIFFFHQTVRDVCNKSTNTFRKNTNNNEHGVVTIIMRGAICPLHSVLMSSPFVVIIEITV